MPTNIKSKTTRYWFEAVLTLLVIAESCIQCIRHVSLWFCRPRYSSTPVLQSTLKTKRSRTFVWIYSVVEDVLGDIWLQKPHILQPSGLKFSLEEYTECDFRTTAVVFFPEIFLKGHDNEILWLPHYWTLTRSMNVLKCVPLEFF
jgi:hypothetical protein